jgi:tRNA threonylcarbamoyladenosine biosynthesis protein TsaE
MGSDAIIISFKKYGLDDIKRLGIAISKCLFPGAKVLLLGDLGTGKTTLTSYIINGLSDKPINVTSPTFSLIKVYDTNPRVYHIDLYRLTDPQEIEYLEIFTDSDGVYIIEWANFLDYLTPEERLEIHISYNENIRYRDLYIKSFGEKYEELKSKIEKELYSSVDSAHTKRNIRKGL